MFVVYDKEKQRVPVKIWLKDIKDVEDSCLEQALNVSNHSCIYHHVSLMPDTHTGYAMPIGGVAALERAISPYFVGVDIGCGMSAVKTTMKSTNVSKPQLREIVNNIKKLVPCGVGIAHKREQRWIGFGEYADILAKDKGIEEYYHSFFKWELEDLPGWFEDKTWELAGRNLGTLGSNNHFLELQSDENHNIWLMIHSGSRNLGYKIAQYYHKLAVELNHKWHSNIVNDDSAFLPVDSKEGKDYIRDMTFALNYAKENRKRIMDNFMLSISEVFPKIDFDDRINIHHNFAALENHFGKNVWVHRKGATSAKKGEVGIIPGSMGTFSYIVEGLGNSESFMSCSHGAGRKMGRMEASRSLTKEDCDNSMKGIVYDGFNKMKMRKKNKNEKLYDLGEAPLAYKDIDDVIENEKDLVKPIVKLRPLAVVKG